MIIISGQCNQYYLLSFTYAPSSRLAVTKTTSCVQYNMPASMNA